MNTILATETLEDEIPTFTPENFVNNPPVLELSGIFCEADIPYSEEEYAAHLCESKTFAAQNPNYTLQLYKEALNHAFDEPKQWKIREINEIMNQCVTG